MELATQATGERGKPTEGGMSLRVAMKSRMRGGMDQNDEEALGGGKVCVCVCTCALLQVDAPQVSG